LATIWLNVVSVRRRSSSVRAFQSWFRYNAAGGFDGAVGDPLFAILAWVFSLTAADERTIPVGQLQKSGNGYYRI